MRIFTSSSQAFVLKLRMNELSWEKEQSQKFRQRRASTRIVTQNLTTVQKVSPTWTGIDFRFLAIFLLDDTRFVGTICLLY